MIRNFSLLFTLVIIITVPAFQIQELLLADVLHESSVMQSPNISVMDIQELLGGLTPQMVRVLTPMESFRALIAPTSAVRAWQTAWAAVRPSTDALEP